MRVEQESKITVEKLRLISGFTQEHVREFFESLSTLLILDYLESSSTHIPFFGEVKIQYLKDKISKKGKQAIIRLEFTPKETLLKNIGQIIDNEESDIEKFLMKKIRLNLHNYLNIEHSIV